MMAHFATCGPMPEAALKADTDPDWLSFLRTVRVIRRKRPQSPDIPPYQQMRSWTMACSTRFPRSA
jgi:hypothetical protein